MTIPQYAKSTDPTVLAAISANAEGIMGVHRQAVAFAIAQGVEEGSYYPSSFAGLHSIRALGGASKPTTGRWTGGYGGYGWRPFKNNPLYKEMDAIAFREQEVPGLPALVNGPDSGWQRIVSSPRPFILDGVAYVGFSFQPSDEQDSKSEEGFWEEIKASEYHAALEKKREQVDR